jgi:hypothetical protein
LGAFEEEEFHEFAGSRCVNFEGSEMLQQGWVTHFQSLFAAVDVRSYNDRQTCIVPEGKTDKQSIL